MPGRGKGRGPRDGRGKGRGPGLGLYRRDRSGPGGGPGGCPPRESYGRSFEPSKEPYSITSDLFLKRKKGRDREG